MRIAVYVLALVVLVGVGWVTGHSMGFDEGVHSRDADVRKLSDDLTTARRERDEQTGALKAQAIEHAQDLVSMKVLVRQAEKVASARASVIADLDRWNGSGDECKDMAGLLDNYAVGAVRLRDAADNGLASSPAAHR
jgi:hypothetical protein